jgi:signal transduction histidine kinase
MKLTLSTCVLLLVVLQNSVAQTYAPSERYLVDSLDLESASPVDIALIDSALSIFHNSSHDTTKINAINIIVEESWDDNIWPKYNQWVHDFVVAAKLVAKDMHTLTHLERSYAQSLNNTGFLYNRKGMEEEALVYFNKSLESDNHPDRAGTLVNIGAIHLKRGQVEQALSCYYAGLSIEEERGNEKGIATMLNAIAYVYDEQNEVEEAIAYYNRSLDIRKRIDDKYGVATCLNNLGLIYYEADELESALDYFNESWKLEEEIADKFGIALSLANIGLVYSKQQLYQKALDFFERSLALREELGDMEGIAHGLGSIASVEIKLAKFAEAKKNALRSLTLANDLGYPRVIRDAAQSLSEVSKAENNWKAASTYFELYVLMRDSISNQQLANNTIRQKYKYKYERKALLDSVNVRREEKIVKAQLVAERAEKEQQQVEAILAKTRSYFLLGALFLALIFIVLLYSRYRIIKHQRMVIVEHDEALKLANAKLEKALREEKQLGELRSRFISTASHQFRTPLAVIQANSELLQMLATKSDGDLFSTMQKSTYRISGEIKRITDVVDQLLTAGKSSHGAIPYRPQLTDVVEICTDMVQLFSGIQDDGRELAFKLFGEQREVESDPNLLNHILLNLLNNAFKYSKGCENPELSVTFEPNRLIISVKDYGIGIPDSEIPHLFQPFFRATNVQDVNGTGLGLNIAQEYSKLNKGVLSVQSEQGKMTIFTVVF